MVSYSYSVAQGGDMAAHLRVYEDVILRIPYVKSASVLEEAGVTRIQVLSDGRRPPRQIVREIVALVRSYGFRDISNDDVTVLEIQPDDEVQGRSRLQIAGLSVAQSTVGVEASCRLSRGRATFEGKGQGSTLAIAVAMATVEAVNQALAPLEQLIFHGLETTRVGGIEVMVVTIADPDTEFLAGCSVVRDTIEDTVVRATLDAVNRRVRVYSGQKV